MSTDQTPSGILEQDISHQIWFDSYKWETDKDPLDTFRRIAKAIASVEPEDKRAEWEEKYYDLLSHMRYLPGGRIISNAGTKLKNTTLVNCFVSGFQGKNQDSMEGITAEKSRMAKILASEGGYGCNFDVIRPKGSYIHGIGVETPGAVKWMESWDTDSGVITAGSGAKSSNKGKNKIRKGAMMGTLSIWNPGIEEFITVKQQPGKLSRFNLSVLITDEFMDCVENHRPWNLEYPDVEFDKYDDEWDGDLGGWKAKGYPTNVWFTYEDANALWETIMKSTYNRNEPGVIFVDRYNELNNLAYLEKIRCTNPCVVGSTVIETTEGRWTIKEMAEEYEKSKRTFDVYSVDMETGKLVINKAVKVFKTKTVDTIARVEFTNGTVLECTPDHKIYDARTRKKYPASEIKRWLDSASENDLAKFKKFKPIALLRTKASEKYLRVKSSIQKGYVREHRFVAAYYHGQVGSDKDVHHIDGNSFNNHRDNLDVMDHGDHSVTTNVGHPHWSNHNTDGTFKVKDSLLRKQSLPAPVELLTKAVGGAINFKAITYVNETHDVYDMTVENTHNYIANGICISNCGEQGLPVNGSCNLGSINLTQYVLSDRKGYDYEALKRDIPTIVRFQDSINDISNFPLKAQKEEAQNKRRAGIGYMGYGSSLYLMKIRYGSPKALEMTEELLEHNVNQIYQASAHLAKEKGAFPAFDKDKYLKSMFVKLALTDETVELIKKNGLRNSHLTTVAPTGNSGIFANNVSGGLEPVISSTYIRSISVPVPPEGMIMPKNINWETRECENKDGWTWDSEGDEFILKTVFKGTHYKIERTRGLAAEQKVMDYAVMHMDDFDKTAKYAVGINDLSAADHIETMKIFAKFTDSSISKTINVPADFTYDDFKGIYKDAFDTGYIKGITTYRHGTMTAVLKVESDDKKAEHIDTDRPKTLPCNIHRISILGRDEKTGGKIPEKWIVFIGLKENKPYEVFAGKIADVNIPKAVTEGQITKVRSAHYSLVVDEEVIINDISKTFDNKDHDAFCRLTSCLLRKGCNVSEIIEQLSKCKGTLADIHKAIINALKKYVKDGDRAGTCPNCGAELIFSEGCMKCVNCGASKCG